MRDLGRYQRMGGRMYALANADRHVSRSALAMRNELHCKAEAKDPDKPRDSIGVREKQICQLDPLLPKFALL